LVGKPEGMRSLGRHKCRREDNIKIDLKEIWRAAVYSEQGQVADY
jgi:hypothetical protein